MMDFKRFSNPWFFFVLAFGFSWILWIPAALLAQSTASSLAMILRYAGGLGPAIAGVLLVYLTQDSHGRQDYWQRIIDCRRIGGFWYVITLLAVPVLTFLAILAAALPERDYQSLFENARTFLGAPLSLIPFAIGILIFGPLLEELGWRGYAQDRFQSRYNALISSLVVGAGWALWHIPLYFIAGTFQCQVGFGSALFWLFSLGMLPQSVLIAWVYNNNQRSTLSAILFHFAINFSGEFFSPTLEARSYQFMLITLMASMVAIVWSPKTLTLRTSESAPKR
jgi:membrane protease YdiL (CAAX protease family)